MKNFKFCQPSDVTVKVNYLDGIKKAIIFFRSSIVNPELLTGGDIDDLLKDLNCKNSKFDFCGADFSVYVNNNDLIVDGSFLNDGEIAYLREYILWELQNYSLSSLTDKELAYKLIELTGIDVSVRDAVGETFSISKMKENNARVADNSSDAFPVLMDKIVTVYVECYSKQELIELVCFYQSALGSKVISSIPKITNEISLMIREISTKVGWYR